MPFWKSYYHVVWATKHREPIITPAIELVLFEAIRSKSAELNCTVLAVNGAADHVHVAVTIRPSIAAGEWVGQVKGAASRSVNLAFPELEPKFRWQDDYGVVTFRAKNLPFVVAYIENQKQHHQNGSLQSYLERVEA